MKQLIALALIFFFVSGIQAQKTLNLKDATLGAGSYLRPNLPMQLLWRDAQRYMVVKDSALYQVELKKKTESRVISVSELNKSLRSFGFKVVGNIPRFTIIDASRIWFQLQSQLVVFNLENKQIVQTLSYPQEAANLDFCTANSTLAFTQKNNLFIAGNSGNQQITNDGE